MQGARAGAMLAAVFLAVCAAAHAEMPYPSNPMPCADGNADGRCIAATAFSEYLFLPATEPLTLPNDFGSTDWKSTSGRSGNPQIDNNPQELFGVTGASVDLAWQVTTGRPDVVIAVLDSGIRWAEPLPDVVNKFYLNRGELPVPEGSSNARDPYDRNGDGVFTIKDYLDDGTHPQDTRVRDENGNGMIDPEDLIFLFSDGVDDDRNGYVDDISGWDFFEDDNDPLDEVRYGHGTGESHDSSAEANNGGDVGTCPNCLLLEARVGDSFVTDVNLFAQGVVFAVDSGARVVQEALGTLNQSHAGQQAVDYAYRNGVVVMASAADEASNHHNYPANYNHTVEVNSVTRFADLGGIVQSPPSYLYLNGCTNFGGHIAVSVPSSSCSSEATGRGSGMAGLVISAALNAVDRGTLSPYPRDDGTPAPYPLSAEEIKQLLTLTADDIDFDARDDVVPPLPQNYAVSSPFPGVQQSQRYPSIAGWDQAFGYGRINANQAVRRVAAGTIPPEAAIESPAWFEVIDPESANDLVIQGRVAANRAGAFSYRIEVAPGIQPRESEFVADFVSPTYFHAVEGPLGHVDIAALRTRMPHGTEGPAVDTDGRPDADRFTFTVRVRVMDDQGNLGEDRRTLALHHDSDQLAGFPLQLHADGVSAPLTADLDADGREEIIVGTSNGEVHAFRSDGSEVPGWPVLTDPLEIHADAHGYASGAVAPLHGAILGGVAVGDLAADGRLAVVATDMAGKVYVWNPDGTRRAGFPQSTLAQYSNSRRSERDLASPEGRVPDRTNRHTSANRLGRALASGPVLGNLDGSADGSLEIIAGAFDRHLYAWRYTGEPLHGWPVLLKDPAKVASVDPVTNEVTLDADAGAAIGTKIIVPPSLGDLDGDGRLDVVAVVNEEYREEPNARFTNLTIGLYRAAGAIKPGNTRVYAVRPDGVAAGAAGIDHGWNPDAFLPGWPVKTALLTTELLPVVGTGSNGPPALADVDGDGRLEIATGSAIGPAYVLTATGQSFFGQAAGRPITLATDTLGAGSNSTDVPTFFGLGAPVLAEFGGSGQGFQFVGPAAGLGKLIDNQLPALQTPADNQLGAWELTRADGTHAAGDFSPAFPRVVNDLQFFGSPAVADITGDGMPEAISGSGLYDIHAVDVSGREAPGWPKFTGGWMIGSPVVGDLDGDGKLEVVATTREGNLFAWRTAGDECGFIPWRHYHHDEHGSGNYHTDARPPASLRPADVAGMQPGFVVLPDGDFGTVPIPGSVPAAQFLLTHLPGNDLFCGVAHLDVRFADTPIDSEPAFAAASAAAYIAAETGKMRAPGKLWVADARFAGRDVYFGLVATDDAGNRSALVPLGHVLFEAPTSTPTVTPTPTVSPTRTQAASPSATAEGTVTPTARAAVQDEGGCTVHEPHAGAASTWLLLGTAIILWRRRRA